MSEQRTSALQPSWLTVGCLVALCIALRLIFLATWSEDYTISPVDPHGFWALGRNLAAGKGLSWGQEAVPTAQRTPMYPMMLAAVHLLTGGDQRTALASQAALDALTTVAVYLLALVTTGSRTPAALAAGAWAVYVPEISEITRFWSEPLCALLLTVGLMIFIRGCQRCSGLLFGLAGLVLGGAGLTRPEYLLLPIVLAVLTIIRYSTALPRHRWVLAMLLLAGLGTAWLPWIARNVMAFGRVVPTTTLAGLTLYAGNVSLDRQDYLLHLPSAYALVKIKEQVSEKEMSEAQRAGEIEVDRLYLREALRLIAAHPGRYVKLSGLRAARLWFPVGFRSRTTWRGASVACVNLILLALAAIGAVVARRQGFYVAPLLLLLAYGIAVYLPFKAGANYAYPMVPTLTVLSALGTWKIWSKVRTRFS